MIIEHRDRIPKEIAWEDFMRTLDKIRVQGKAVFSDFMRAGEEFKIATFLFLQRVYKEEVLPESMRVTYLTSIWKRRGDPSRLKNMRFIHNKTWLPKLFEKLIVLMVEARWNPKMQFYLRYSFSSEFMLGEDNSANSTDFTLLAGRLQ